MGTYTSTRPLPDHSFWADWARRPRHALQVQSSDPETYFSGYAVPLRGNIRAGAAGAGTLCCRYKGVQARGMQDNSRF